MDENEEKKDVEQANKQEEIQKTNEQEEVKQQEEPKLEQEPEKNNQPEENKVQGETKKEASKPKGKKKTKIIIAVVLIIAILAGVGFGVFYYLTNKEDTEKEDKLDWGDVYLEVLEDDDEKLSDLDERKIQLLDLDKDSIPELIVYGLKNGIKHIANIFKINDKNKVDTIQVELDDEFDIELLYNIEKDDYNWYAVAENKEESSDESNSKVVYDLNIDTEKYEPNKLDVNFDLDIVEVEDNYSKKVDFEKDLSKKEIKEAFEDAKENYVETEDMITEEVEKKVEELKVYKNVKRKDKAKGLVYTVRKYSSNYGNKYEYPAINIDSEDIEKINKEIEEEYGFSEEEKDWLIGMELTEISYSYNVKDKYLSVVVKKGGNQSVWASGYVINLEDSTRLTSDKLLEKENLDKSEVLNKVKEVALNDFNSQLEKEKSSMGDTAWTQLSYESSKGEWKSDLEKNVSELKNIYFNEDGDLCVIVEYEHPGGQWSCTKSLIINISKNYSVTELKLNNGDASDPKFEQAPEPTPTPTPTPAQTPTTNTNSSSTSTSNTPTAPAITKEQAQKLAESQFGDATSDPPVVYGYAGWGTYNGKEYYVFDMRWNLGDHTSWIGTVCVCTDGKSYEQLDLPVSSELKGSALKISPGYGGTF